MYFNYYFCYLSFLSVLDGTLSCTTILPAGINKSFSESIFWWMHLSFSEYLHSDQRCREEELFRKGLNQTKPLWLGRFLILGRDFICTECEVLDRKHAEPHPGSQHALKQLVHSHDLMDVWWRMHVDCLPYTWSCIVGLLWPEWWDRIWLNLPSFDTCYWFLF